MSLRFENLGVCSLAISRPLFVVPFWGHGWFHVDHSGLRTVVTFRVDYFGFLCFDVVPGIIILDVGLDIMS